VAALLVLGLTAMTITDEVAFYAVEGHDREGAAAMLSQSRLGYNPIDDIQVLHLLNIGYRAGRQVTEADTVFDRTDTRLGKVGLFLGGASAGALLCLVAVWVFA
jgi:hypothetical protein